MQNESGAITVTWPSLEELRNIRAASQMLGMPVSRFLRQAAAQRLETAANDLGDPELLRLAERHRVLRAYA